MNYETIGNRPQNEKYPYAVFKVGDRANERGYTDVRPCTVVKVERNGSRVIVRSDKFERNKDSKPEFVPGGFAGHCTNQHEIKYDISEDLNGYEAAYTLRKWRGRYCWTAAGCSPDGRNQIGKGWRAFYDYNF